MRKILTTLIVAFATVLLTSQSFIDLNFTGTFPPAGWTISAQSSHWLTSGTTNAGGQVPECMFKYDPAFTGTSYFTSPNINTTGLTSLKFEFSHMVDFYATPFTVGVATRSGGGAWNVVWSTNPTGNINARTETINISNADVGSATFQIAFYFSGNSNNIDYWYIDDVKLYNPLAHDVRVKKILCEPEYLPNTSFVPQVIVNNFGLNSESFTTTCTIKLNNGAVYTQTSPIATVAPATDLTINFPAYVLAAANDIYEITFQTNLAGDLNTSNDMASKEFDTYTTERSTVLLEIGTGTWCQYCPGASMGAHELITNGKKVSVVKYHNGDTFTNPFSNARNTYYSITGFPTAVFDGVEKIVGGSNTVSMYTDYLPKYEMRKVKKSAFGLEIYGTHAGDVYTITLKVNKNAKTPSTLTDPKVHLALTESNINFSWQGQSKVDYAERLMAPDQNGTALDFTGGNEKLIELTFTKDAAWVAGNCELVAFIQNSLDKEIMQSVKVPLLELLPLPVELVAFNASVVNRSVMLDWATASELNNSGFVVEKSLDGISFYTIGFVKGAGTTNEKQTYSFYDNSDNDANTVLYYRIKQVDFNGTETYSSIVSAELNVPVIFNLSQNYPNPFNPSTKINYSIPEAGQVTIKLYDLNGQEVKTLVNEMKPAGFYELNINADGLASGVYIYKMISGNFVNTKKMCILK